MSHSLAAIAWLIDAYPALQMSTQPSHKMINPLAPMTSTDIIQTLCTFRASHYYRKCHRWALDNLGPSFGHNLKNLSDFGMHPPLNLTLEVQLPRRIETGIWHSGLQESVHTDGHHSEPVQFSGGPA